MMVRAIIALTAGSTVLTPISQGNIKFTPEYILFLRVNYLSMTPVITPDACQNGLSTIHTTLHFPLST
jgi:hypothetical protein